MQQQVSFDPANLCCFPDDVRTCGAFAENATLIILAIVVALALHPRVLGGALNLVGEPPSAIRRLGVPGPRVPLYRTALITLCAMASVWMLAGLYHGPYQQVLLDYTRPALMAVVALIVGATCGGLALLIALAQHTLERRLGSGFASLLLGASAIGAALSMALMHSLHALSFLAGAIVGAAVLSLYRAVDGLPWYAAVTGCALGALLAFAQTLS
jgi:hypothetical protein